MLRKIAVILLFSTTLSAAYAQETNPQQLLKHITTAPDGTRAITIYDDTKNTTMQLEAAHSFYKYELLDLNTMKQVYARTNRGNKCTINKLAIVPGTYKLRLFTKNFIISSTLSIVPIAKNSVAISD